jgi:molecular chaperone DnaJ
MAIKDYYLILGVSRDETPEGIRAAFRELAKRYHPDLAGAESTPEFQQIVEAYEVLSDPVRRSQHNRELAAAEAPVRSRPSAPLEDEFRRLAASLAGYRPPAWSSGAAAVRVVLNPAEALRGVEAPLRIRLAEPCPACRGTGRDWLLPCWECGGRGAVAAYRTVWIRTPPGVRSGEVIELAAGGLRLRLEVVVAPY